MTAATQRSAVLCGVGSALPERVVDNEEAGAPAGLTDEWIRQRTGIRTRHHADPGTPTSVLGAAAARAAIADAGDGADPVDGVVLATTTPDRRCPATAPAVADALELDGAAAFDVGAVCSGFVYALAAGAGLISAGVLRCVAVVGAEVYSTIVDPADRTTAPLFGDGAGAVVLRAGHAEEPGALGPFDLGSDGAHRDLITVPGGTECAPPAGRPGTLTLSGREVFWHASHRMSGSARAAVQAAGWAIDELDLVVAHQASGQILDQVSKGLGIATEKVFSHLSLVGNTAGASIPLALDAARATGALRAGDRVLLTAFGGGLSWGSTTLRWPGQTVA